MSICIRSVRRSVTARRLQVPSLNWEIYNWIEVCAIQGGKISTSYSTVLGTLVDVDSILRSERNPKTAPLERKISMLVATTTRTQIKKARPTLDIANFVMRIKC